jgi:predicted component of type VI protein secretion system
MPVYLEIIDGPHCAQTVALAPGEIAKVGRAQTADWCLANDGSLSEVQFIIAADEQAGFLCDLGSKNGTFLNGNPVTAARIAHGDMIRAGASTFAVLLETDPATNLVERSNSTMTQTPISKLVGLLKELAPSLFAILDAACDARILPLLKESEAMYQSLYNGRSEIQLAEVAPYLVKFRDDDPLLEQVIRRGWGKAWGIFGTSPHGAVTRRRRDVFSLLRSECAATFLISMQCSGNTRVLWPRNSIFPGKQNADSRAAIYGNGAGY